jgi:hypothetical protein
MWVPLSFPRCGGKAQGVSERETEGHSYSLRIGTLFFLLLKKEVRDDHSLTLSQCVSNYSNNKYYERPSTTILGKLYSLEEDEDKEEKFSASGLFFFSFFSNMCVVDACLRSSLCRKIPPLFTLSINSI